MEIRLFISLLLVLLSAFGNLHAQEPAKKKILLLIIASDNFPVYEQFQKCWRSYMHSDPEHIEAYFVKGDPLLREKVKIDGDIIWCKTAEGFAPQSPALINKTIMAFETLLPRIQQEFDYVIRTSVSCFYHLPRLFAFLDTLPPNKCYAGSNTGPGSDVISGAGIILSPDLVEMLVYNKYNFWNRTDPDDCLIGFFFRKFRTPLHLHRRINIESLDQWNAMKSNISSPDDFQFRVKTDIHNFYHRIPDDITIYSELCEMFYGNRM